MEEELMADPLRDRVVSEAACPRLPNKPLSMDRVFPIDPRTGDRAYSPETDLIMNF